jgi:phosphatidylserine/phosphatidylglycerophosphate/cardiolipin synthase-like enzyme
LSQTLAGLGVEALRSLADALEGGRVAPPYSALSLERYVPAALVPGVSAELRASSERGAGPVQIAFTLRMVAAERERAQRSADHVELVWSGPELPGAVSRDTAVVVRELFSSARQTVLVAGYAVYQGRQVFAALAENMDARPELRTRMFFNVSRDPGDDRSDAELTREFADRFREREWPGRRLPEVYYDPRSLSREPGPRACLHAKCIVVDSTAAFVTSANFTEAAQERNIEAGVLVRSPAFAQALAAQFETLLRAGALRRLAGVG